MERQVCPDAEGGGMECWNMGILPVDKGHPDQDWGRLMQRLLGDCDTVQSEKEESEPEQEAKEQESGWQIEKGTEIRMYRI